VLPDNAAALVGAGVLSVIVCDLTLDPDRSGRNSNPKLVPAASAALQALSVQASLNHDLPIRWRRTDTRGPLSDNLFQRAL
jgi:hypothetical protein